MRGTRNFKTAPYSKRAVAVVALALSAWSAAAVIYFYSHGYLLDIGDAESHLDIARRVVDSRTPGYEQFGSVWLPLPHALMLPFVKNDWLWLSGLAGAIPAAACFVLAGVFLFATARRLFGSTAAGVAAAALFAANPNLLYLQSTAMTEAPFFASLAGLLYFSVRFRETQGWGAVAGAGLAACAGALTRYEAWFLLPFAAAYFFFAARRRRLLVAAVFSALAGAGPLYWLAHNWILCGDPLEFYRGPYSARSIQGSGNYPGKGDWGLAWLQFRTAARLCAGPALPWIALAGALVALARRVFWPLLLLALPTVFYVWSVHSSGTPIYVPELWPHTHYNTRYGLAALPLLALATAALTTLAPRQLRAVLAALVIAAGAIHWAVDPRPEGWVTWKEYSVNQAGWRAGTQQAADYLRPRYTPGTGIVTSFGYLTAIYRRAGIPLRETFTGDNGLIWEATMSRPELYLRHEWAVALGDDAVEKAIERAGRFGIHYRLEKAIIVKDSPVIRIYRR